MRWGRWSDKIRTFKKSIFLAVWGMARDIEKYFVQLIKCQKTINFPITNNQTVLIITLIGILSKLSYSTLDPDQTRQACTYTNRQGKRVRPRWHNPSRSSGNQDNTGSKQRGTHPGKQQPQEGQGHRRIYYPSFNLAPTAIT